MNNVTILRPETGAAAASVEAAQIVADYLSTQLAIPMIPARVAAIAAMIASGCEPEMLLMAAESTSYAPRPSWNYFAAIVRRCIEDHATTPERYQARLEDHRHSYKLFGGYKAFVDQLHAIQDEERERAQRARA